MKLFNKERWKRAGEIVVKEGFATDPKNPKVIPFWVSPIGYLLTRGKKKK